LSDPARTRRRTRWAIAWFVVSTLLLVDPAFFVLGNHIEPRVAGLPWSLVYVLLVVTANFGVLSWLYVTRSVDDIEESESSDD
jgi:hypothetical protein